MNLSDYRNFVQDVITSIYALMMEYQGSIGTDMFFNYITKLLNSNNNNNVLNGDALV